MSKSNHFSQQSNEKATPQWKKLIRLEQLPELVQESYNIPVVLFKHSVSCGLSAMVKYQLEEEWNFKHKELSFYYLDLINHRDVSNKIAEEFDIVHQSPQVIVLHKGKPIANTSHYAIGVSWLRDQLANVS
jgi:bacillithiol system protein YtxJ